MYGVVDHFVSPRRCSGRDLVMNAILVDEGMNTNGIHVNIFQRNMDGFPGGGSLQRGDVLRCHRMMIQPYQGRLQALGSSNRRTAYVVFRADSSSSSGFVAKSTTKNFTMESSEVPQRTFYRPTITYSTEGSTGPGSINEVIRWSMDGLPGGLAKLTPHRLDKEYNARETVQVQAAGNLPAGAVVSPIGD